MGKNWSNKRGGTLIDVSPNYVDTEKVKAEKKAKQVEKQRLKTEKEVAARKIKKDEQEQKKKQQQEVETKTKEATSPLEMKKITSN